MRFLVDRSLFCLAAAMAMKRCSGDGTLRIADGTPQLSKVIRSVVQG
jgi:hypothetical protein